MLTSFTRRDARACAGERAKSSYERGSLGQHPSNVQSVVDALNSGIGNEGSERSGRVTVVKGGAQLELCDGRVREWRIGKAREGEGGGGRGCR